MCIRYQTAHRQETEDAIFRVLPSSFFFVHIVIYCSKRRPLPIIDRKVGGAAAKLTSSPFVYFGVSVFLFCN